MVVETVAMVSPLPLSIEASPRFCKSSVGVTGHTGYLVINMVKHMVHLILILQEFY